MHADRPGDRPRLLYWYRTAPGVMLGRAALDEDAIRTIEEQHPDIDFDWPAIIALSEVMTPGRRGPGAAPAAAATTTTTQGEEGRAIAIAITSREQVARVRRPLGRSLPRLRRDDRDDESPVAVESVEPAVEQRRPVELLEPVEPLEAAARGLVDELAGREIAGRLRARYAEIVARIDSLDLDGAAREAWLTRAEAIDPDAWESPEAVLHGVSNADALFEKLKTELRE